MNDLGIKHARYTYKTVKITDENKTCLNGLNITDNPKE